MPREDRIRTLWRFLGPVDSASSLGLLSLDFDRDLYTLDISAMFDCLMRRTKSLDISDWEKDAVSLSNLDPEVHRPSESPHSFPQHVVRPRASCSAGVTFDVTDCTNLEMAEKQQS